VVIGKEGTRAIFTFSENLMEIRFLVSIELPKYLDLNHVVGEEKADFLSFFFFFFFFLLLAEIMVTWFSQIHYLMIN